MVLEPGGIDALPDGAMYGDPGEVDTIANVAERGWPLAGPYLRGCSGHGCSWDRTSGRRRMGRENTGPSRPVAGGDRAYSYVLHCARVAVTTPTSAADKEEGMMLLSVPEQAVR